MRARTIRRVLAFTVVLTLVSVPAIAQNLVRGTVLDGDKNPVVGALIQFEAIEFVNKRETKTDKRGEFLYQGLPSGEYKITVTKDGFTDSVKCRVHAESSKERVNFTLAATPKPRVTGPPGLESLGDDAKAVAKGKELTEVQALATAAVAAQRAGQHGCGGEVQRTGRQGPELRRLLHSARCVESVAQAVRRGRGEFQEVE
jgi:hypothetical protein